ncbi:MAG: DNA polymerase III subunit chi [Parachlamydiaceae bacterium]|nr:DNA polymerase III subunit chi [Parachlamydiaceae bacterium]
MTTPKVIFIPVKDSNAKRQALVIMAQRFFSNKMRVLFSVANDEVARYVDELLWKSPSESFLPHAIIMRPSPEPIGITTLLENLNEATVLFNLRPEANPLALQFAFTYDLFDTTQPDKLALSQRRKEAYVQQGFLVS